MSRWRKVDVRVWGDERVRQLSRSAPSGLLCWLYLLTARESTALPGAIPAGPGALAESLGWTRRAFLQRFAEVEDHGMAEADWGAGLVWLPNALRYNPPQSPNAVKAWAKAWDELPDCDLKERMRRETEAFLGGLKETFQEAFAQGIHRGIPHTEEKQKKEQKSGKPSVANGATSLHAEGRAAQPDKRPTRPSEQGTFASWFEEQRKVALDGTWTEDKHLSNARLNTELGWVTEADQDLVRDAVRLYLDDPRRRAQDPPCSLLYFSHDRADYLSKAKRGAA